MTQKTDQQLELERLTQTAQAMHFAGVFQVKDHQSYLGALNDYLTGEYGVALTPYPNDDVSEDFWPNPVTHN